MVPEGWERLPLEKVAQVRTGVAKGKGGLKNPVKVPYLRVANVQDGHINLDEVKEIEVEQHQLERYALKYGDVLMNEGGDFDKLGRGDVWLGQIRPCLHQNHVFAVRPKKDKIDSYYLAALAASSYGKTYFLSCAKRSTNLASINSTQLKDFPVLVPPLHEQRKIAKILSIWDKAILAMEELLASRQQEKKALQQMLLTGRKRLLDDHGMRFSEEWKHGRLGDLCSFKGGSAFKEIYQGAQSGDLPFIKVSDMNLLGNEKYIRDSNNWVSKEEASLMKAKPFKKGTVVFAKVGAALLMNRRRVLTMNTLIDNNMMAAIPLGSVCSSYLYQVLLVVDFAKLVQDGAVPSVNQSELSKFKISYPGIEEQRKIADVLSIADKGVETIKKCVSCLKREKKALMQKLLTGKIRVSCETQVQQRASEV